MNDQLMTHGGSSLDASGAATVSRAMEQVRGAIFMARQFPRDEGRALKRIEGACQNARLAEIASYAYPRGGQTIVGPSIRLAEVLAQNWGNLQFGLKWVDRNKDESRIVAFCWDLETNVHREAEFVVPHIRDTKKGPVVLTDERDIYEIAANMGARRLRSAILAIIPRHIVDAAVDQCGRTLEQQGSIEKKRADVVAALGKHGVLPTQIEERIGKKIHAMTGPEYVQLQRIAVSLNEGASKVEQWFSTLDPKKNADVRAAPDSAPPATPKDQADAEDELTKAVRNFEDAKQAALAVKVPLDEALGGKLARMNASTDPVMLRAATLMLVNATNQKGKG